ncbi:MAG: helix-turn-helix domain-containing protein [Acidobacteriota bacterium]
MKTEGKNRPTLSEYVRQVMREENISQRHLVERAERRGFKITQSYISQIISGAASNVTIEKLQALAAALNRPEEELFDIARGGKTDPRVLSDAVVTTLLAKFSRLPEEDKNEMTILLKALDREIEDRLRKSK